MSETHTNMQNQSQLPSDLPYEQWIDYVFDHPVLDPACPAWWWDDDGIYWDESEDTSRTLSYLTRLFKSPGFLIERFTRAQIDQGLRFLQSPVCSSYMSTLLDVALPWEGRRACIDAFVSLYTHLLAPVYGDDLGLASDRPVDPQRPTHACAMWWDEVPLHPNADHVDAERINEAVLHVFVRVLTTPSAESCLESVLFGVSYWGIQLQQRTAPILTRFLSRTDTSPRIRSLAQQAGEGLI